MPNERCGYVRIGDTCDGCNQLWAECTCWKNATITVGSTDTAELAWFWSEKWQAAERQVDTDLANGLYETFDTMDEFLDDLQEKT